MAQLIPHSVLKDVTALSAFAQVQQKLVSDAINPFLGLQVVWQTQFSVINSDIFKTAALQQPNLNLIASQLTKNMDFGLSETMSKIAAQFATQQASGLEGVGPSLANITARVHPPNLQSIEGLESEQVEQVVMVDGIALYGVPHTSTAEALIRADGASMRREILGRRWKPSHPTAARQPRPARLRPLPRTSPSQLPLLTPSTPATRRLHRRSQVRSLTPSSLPTSRTTAASTRPTREASAQRTPTTTSRSAGSSRLLPCGRRTNGSSSRTATLCRPPSAATRPPTL
ncbi:hypothetical protein [Amycolatopsis sp. NPDC051903]|uniref:hypothetical protein n=1 Tax=Amycolatopsis sp. NPDC051903 TaxID=3363936 RepID=UPI0037B3402C